MESAGEVILAHTSQERETYEVLADLYSIFVATEALEKAYIRDAIQHDEYFTCCPHTNRDRYSLSCTKLIAQFKTLINALGSSFSIGDFIETYKIHCPAAQHRLVEVGVPATIEHPTAHGSQHNTTRHVAETVQLNMVAVDQVQPLVKDLMQSLGRVTTLPATFEGKAKIVEWLKKMNRMRASDELTEEDTRQLLFDLEGTLAEFHQSLR